MIVLCQVRTVLSLYHLVYVSQFNLSIDYGTLTTIFTVSQQNNAKQGITGFLCYRKGEFWQYIEGNKDDIHTLLNKLRLDRRHHSLAVLSQGFLRKRRFKSWSMHCTSFDTIVHLLPIGCDKTPSLWSQELLDNAIDRLEHHHRLKQSPISWQSKVSLSVQDFWFDHRKFLLLQATLFLAFLSSLWWVFT